jgi:hypothetical protein
MSNSLLTTVTWTASYATTANTWSAKTTISSGTFTVTGTLANYSTQIVVPAAATTGIEILFTVGAQTSGTWVIGEAQFEKSSTVATSFDYRPYGTELALCQRYYYRTTPGIVNGLFGNGYSTSTTTMQAIVQFPTPLRAIPTALEQTATAGNYELVEGATITACTAVPTFGTSTTTQVAAVNTTVGAVLTVGRAGVMRTSTASGTTAYLGWSAEL